MQAVHVSEGCLFSPETSATGCPLISQAFGRPSEPAGDEVLGTPGAPQRWDYTLAVVLGPSDHFSGASKIVPRPSLST